MLGAGDEVSVGQRSEEPAREPTLTELRAFIAVAEERHFRRAAERLHVAPPPLSQTIRRLEDKVGAVLMERTPRTVTLTDAGRELLPRARDILERMADAQAAVRTTDERQRVVRVGIMSNGFAELTGPILEAYCATHPRTRIHLLDITSDAAGAVIRGTVDLGLIRPPIGQGDDPRVTIEDVVMEPRAALLPPTHRLVEAQRLGVADIMDDVFVAVGPPLPQVCAFWAAADERGGAPTRYGAEAWSVADVMNGVAYLGNTCTSFPSILRYFRAPGVCAVPLPDAAPAPMSVITRTGDRRSAVADLAATVRSVSELMIELVPGAWVVEEHRAE